MKSTSQDRNSWRLSDWELELSGDPVPSPSEFTSDELEGLDEPVRRHLSQAIAIGTPIARAVRLNMRGSIKLRRWLPFRARQVINPHLGFIWSARVAGVITGSDQYLNGVGGMDWKLAGLLTVAHAEGADVSRSAAGRGGAESIWLPSAILPRYGVRWSAQDDTHITAHHEIDGTPVDIHLTLDGDAGIQSVVFDRWGDPDETGNWAWHPFGGEFTHHRTFGGLRIPSSGSLGWHFGTNRWPEGEFFRYEIKELLPLNVKA